MLNVIKINAIKFLKKTFEYNLINQTSKKKIAIKLNFKKNHKELYKKNICSYNKKKPMIA
jgi:hypothetical protein